MKTHISIFILCLGFCMTEAVSFIRGRNFEDAKTQCKKNLGNITIFKDQSSPDLNRLFDQRPNVTLWNGFEVASTWIENTGCFERHNVLETPKLVKEGMNVVECQSFCKSSNPSYIYAIRENECACLLETDIKEHFRLVESTNCILQCNNERGEYCGSYSNLSYFNIYKEALIADGVLGKGNCLRYNWKANERNIKAIPCDSDILVDIIACRKKSGSVHVGQMEEIDSSSGQTWTSSLQNCAKFNGSNYLISSNDQQNIQTINLDLFYLNERRYTNSYEEKPNDVWNECQILSRDRTKNVLRDTRNCSNLANVEFICKLDNALESDMSTNELKSMTIEYVEKNQSIFVAGNALESDMSNDELKSTTIECVEKNRSIFVAGVYSRTHHGSRTQFITIGVVLIIILLATVIGILFVSKRKQQQGRGSFNFRLLNTLTSISNGAYCHNSTADLIQHGSTADLIQHGSTADLVQLSTQNLESHYTTIHELIDGPRVTDMQLENHGATTSSSGYPIYYILEGTNEESMINTDLVTLDDMETENPSSSTLDENEDYDHLNRQTSKQPPRIDATYAHAYFDPKSDTCQSETRKTEK